MSTLINSIIERKTPAIRPEAFRFEPELKRKLQKIEALGWELIIADEVWEPHRVFVKIQNKLKTGTKQTKASSFFDAFDFMIKLIEKDNKRFR